MARPARSSERSSARSPLGSGVLLAALAAVAFGSTTPVIERASRGLGPLLTAALLYGGAALAALGLRPFARPSGARLGGRQAPRLLAVAACGAVLAPVLFVWGLRRTGATTGSLVLNLEAVFTVLLARLWYREPIGPRVAVAVSALALGGLLVGLETTRGAAWHLVGVLAVTGATLGWALDNTLSRGLAEHDPLDVVAAKGALGALATGILATAAREPLPVLPAALTLLGCGATGYGLSLRLYLLAQRRIGAARTGSVFATAPFLGAALAWVLGDRAGGALTLAGAAACALGVYLHATERHRHLHVHDAVEHEHAHHHDDEHHDHPHDPPVSGEHTHRHRHERLVHDHEHAPDLHHDHRHR